MFEQCSEHFVHETWERTLIDSIFVRRKAMILPLEVFEQLAELDQREWECVSNGVPLEGL
eukprot:SAG31_NODE_6968_length_1831_cov_34.728497_3_plen_60_part_00